MAKQLIGKMIKVSEKAVDAGIYYRLSGGKVRGDKPLKTFYINYRANGKPKWERIGREIDGYTVAYARQIRSDRIRADGQFPATARPNMTFAEGFKVYHDSLYGSKEALLNADKSRYNNHLADAIGHLRLADIKIATIEELRADLSKKNLTDSSIFQICGLIGRVYRTVIDRELYLGHNPWTKLRKDVKDPKRERQTALTMEEGEKFMATLKKEDTTLYRQCAFALYNGLRRKEVLNLTPSDIDLDRGFLYIQTKDSKKQHKIVPVAIQDYLRPIIEEILAEKDWEPTEKFFKPTFNYEKFYKILNQLGFNKGIDRSNIEKWICFHSLRHSLATQLADDGVDTKGIQVLMRHSRISSTSRYTHIREQRQTEIMSQIAKRRKAARQNLQREQLRLVNGGKAS